MRPIFLHQPGRDHQEEGSPDDATRQRHPLGGAESNDEKTATRGETDQAVAAAGRLQGVSWRPRGAVFAQVSIRKEGKEKNEEKRGAKKPLTMHSERKQERRSLIGYGVDHLPGDGTLKNGMEERKEGSPLERPLTKTVIKGQSQGKIPDETTRV